MAEAQISVPCPPPKPQDPVKGPLPGDKIPAEKKLLFFRVHRSDQKNRFVHFH
jgi:hypothetical protein